MAFAMKMIIEMPLYAIMTIEMLLCAIFISFPTFIGLVIAPLQLKRIHNFTCILFLTGFTFLTNR